MHNIIAGRRLAVTQKGHVGLVPSEAEVGDEIAVLFGCSVPLVFRSFPEREGDVKFYRWLVGDSYFRRMMQGQMVEEAGGSALCTAYVKSATDELQSGLGKDTQGTNDGPAEEAGHTWRRLPESGSAVVMQQFLLA